jgi:hypothetical protein
MEKHAPGGIVIDFSEYGYKACTAKEVIEKEGSRAALNKAKKMKSLGTVLGVDFLECSVGTVGLFYDGKAGAWGDFSPSHIFTTQIVMSSGGT